MTETLLQKALGVNYQKRGRRDLSSEDLDLILAWLEGKVSYIQIAITISKKGSNVYNYITRGVKALYLQGRIEIKK